MDDDRLDCPPQKRYAVATIPATKVQPDGSHHAISLPAAAEEHLDVFINGSLVFQTSCTPELLTELVIGRLVTDGFIADISDVEDVVIDTTHDSQARADVTLKATAQTTAKTEARTAEKTRAGLVSPIEWQAEQIFRLAAEFENDTPLHRSTGATHSCRLIENGETIICCEDISRHNALDKAIGHVMMNGRGVNGRGKDLSQMMALVSCRVTEELLHKVLRARIPLLITKATATENAIREATRYGLTLISQASPQSFLIFES